MIFEIHAGLKVFFREGSSDEAVIKHSFSNDIFYPAIPDILIRPAMNIFDIGAHIGTFSLLSCKKFANVRVFAFEPNRESFELLQKNIQDNEIKNIQAINMAVTEKKGKTELYLDNENWGHSTSYRVGSEVQQIESVTLSDFLNEQKIEHCDLIKFNCEGAEFNILYSMKSSSLNKIGMMLILYHEDLASGPEDTLTELYRFLKGNGFYCRVVNKSETRGWLIAKNKNFYKRKIWGLSNLKILLKEIRTLLMFG